MFRFMLAFLCGVLLTGSAGAQDVYDYPGSLAVTGVGYASAEPDEARIVFGVEITRKDPSDAVTEAASLINSAMAAARREGVSGDEMQTVSYNMWVQEEYDDYNYVYTGEMEYFVTHMIRADIKDIGNVGDVLAALVDAGANTITSVVFTVEDESELREEARRAAIQDAVRRAEVIASELDIELGDPTYVSEYDYGYGYYDYYDPYMNYGGGLSAGSMAPSVTPGSYVVSTSISVTFEIID
jgi:uncharacterized protein YggE